MILTSRCGQPTGPIAKCGLIVMKLYNGAQQDVKTNDREVVDVSPKNMTSTVTLKSAKWYLIGLTYDLSIIQLWHYDALNE